jgi:hypothetical protein
MGKMYVGDIGIGIELDTLLSPSILATATNVYIEALLPDKTTTQEWTATIVANTSRIRYVTLGSEITQAGAYQLQARVKMPGVDARGDSVTQIVYSNFN